MSTGDRCSRCSDCSCSRCSENGTGDSESPKSSLFCTCIGQPATATPATAATPRKGQRPALQTIVTQHRRRAAQAALMLWSMQGRHPVPASGSRSQKTPHEAGRCIDLSCTSLRGGRSTDAQELAASVILTAHIVFVPAVGRCSGLRFLEGSGRVRIEPRPHSSARPASLRTLDPVAFLLLDLRHLACCGHLLDGCRALLPAEPHFVAVLMHRQGNPFARDASSDTSATGIHSLGVGRCRLLHVVILCVVDDNAITGCISEKRQAISPATKEQQIPYLTDCARKRLELFLIFGKGRQRVSLLHASRRNRQQRQHTGKGRRDKLPVVVSTESNTRCSAYRVRPSYHALMATNAQHQASYRARQASAGSVRLDTHISADAHAALTTMAERKGLSIRAAVETAIFTSCTTSRKDASMTPTRPTQMTAGEAAELESFKAGLPNAIINAELDQLAQAMNGGAAGVAQKERVTAMLQANNQHFKK